MRKVVIADDEKLSRELIKRLIALYNLPVSIVGEAASGDETINIINKVEPDIVFIDIKMPGYNGIEVIEKTNNSYQKNIDFIIITAYGYFEYAQASLRLGVKDILLKPIDPEQFFNSMERIIGYKYTDNKLFNKILEYVNQNYSKDISLNQCSEYFYTSTNYIARMFKKYCGISFTRYVNNLKIKKAQDMLKNTDMPIEKIAEKVGYKNLNYFYINFKKVVGVTPGTYRKNSNWY